MNKHIIWQILSGSEATEDSIASQLIFKRVYRLTISANEKAARSSTALLQPFIYSKPHETSLKGSSHTKAIEDSEAATTV